MTIEALEDIVGCNRLGIKFPTKTSKLLRKKGSSWAWHVLEVPIVWLMYVPLLL